jgi:HTH-type transcriptional regulator / antitoxin HigA
MNLKPIRTEADHAAALREIDRLLDAPEGTPEADRLEILSTLVADYEDRHHPIDPPDPIEAILFRMEQEGVSRQDLEPLLGTRARVSEILNRKRPLTLKMIRKLSERLHVPAHVLIADYKLKKRRALLRHQRVTTRRKVG